MDRSFLSQPEVIAASRSFVCIRLTTYEDEVEAEFLKSLLRTRSGELENSSFVILGPDGKKRLTRASRGIQSTYSDASAMARDMRKIQESYKSQGEVRQLPVVPEAHLAIDVAASDNQPLVVIVAKDPQKRVELEKVVARLAWDEKWIGRFVYHMAADAGGLKAIEGMEASTVLCVVQPDKFGLKARVLAQTSDDGVSSLEKAMTAGANAFRAEPKSFQSHIREGQRMGVFWEPKTPVTDPQEIQARERGRKK